MKYFYEDKLLLERIREIMEAVARGYMTARGDDLTKRDWERLTEPFSMSLIGVVAGVAHVQLVSTFSRTVVLYKVIFDDESAAILVLSPNNGEIRIDPKGFSGRGLNSHVTAMA
ncbi:MAG: hypothetical protein INF43_00240 [Alphaproteobacteria bacterium]|nr:hypothetical protein [Alphaproteobacteria bacterium]